MTVKQVGSYLNIKPAKVHQLIRTGAITRYRAGHPLAPGLDVFSVRRYARDQRARDDQATEIIREHNRTIGTRTYPQPSRRRAHLNPMAAVLASVAGLSQQTQQYQKVGS